MTDKSMLNRSIGRWCLEFDCWPEDHPGCDKREYQGCDNCHKSINLIVLYKNEAKLSVDELNLKIN